MFIDPLAGRFRENSELVGLCDPSAVRRKFHQRRLVNEYGIEPPPDYADFDKMLREQKPDTVIVCTPDYLHHEYIVRSLEAGLDVISEKPISTDAEKCQAILEAVKRSGRRVRTTFNLRWTPGITKVRELIAAGDIGRVRHINFEYALNTSHGADYFRRWHSEKACSGGLLIHKSTHHFDVLNWWIDGIPSLVFALGGLVFYGEKNALERGEENRTRYARYAAPAAEGDPFRIVLDKDPVMKGLYLEAEAETGYIRDRNVFRDGIDIEDMMSLLIEYRSGVVINYSLNAYSPREGFRASISGDGGRIDYEERHATHIITGAREIKPTEGEFSMRLVRQKLFAEPEEISIPVLEGAHGGGDELLQEQMFSACPPRDLMNRNAGHEQGIASVLIGAAANRSMKERTPVRIEDLLALRPEARRLSELV